MDAAGNSGDLDWQRIADKRRAVFLQAFDGELQRDPCARNRRGAGAAIGLDDVAVERDLTFAKRLEIDDRAQAAADQPLDRKSVVQGKSVYVSVDLGGRRRHKKKNKIKNKKKTR